MSIWTDPIVIPPFQILLTGLLFLANKIIDKKAGRNLTDFERVNYVTDKIADTSVMHSKKIKGVVKNIMSEDEVINSKTIPKIKEYQTDILKEIDELRFTYTQTVTELQLEIDHLKHKLTEAGIDINNGETKEEPILD